MKIICEKCSNEFLLKGDAFGRGVQMVQCPVCKTPIMVKADTSRDFQRRTDRNRSLAKDHDAHHERMSHDPAQRPNPEHQHKGYDDASIQLNMIHQIENSGDMVTSEEQYGTSDGRNDAGRAGNLIKTLKAVISGIDPSSVTKKFVPYVYYALMMFIVFTSLFLFSDVIRLDNARGSVTVFLRSLAYVVTHHL